MKFKVRVLLAFFVSFSFVKAQADWTVLLYIQAGNDLARFAVHNLKDIARVGSNEKVNVLVQIEQPHKKGMWRYKVSKDNIELEEHVPADMVGDCVKDLSNAGAWAFGKYPAKHTAIIENNHGCGILDPFGWSSGPSEPHATLRTLDSMTRGILFNYETRTYMNNQQQLEALKLIKNNVLGGKKIDILGMDACLMAMIEVGYQVKDCVNLLVTSQEVELAYGWSYAKALEPIAVGGSNPTDFVQSIVSSYDQFYKGRLSWYTQSAIDLNQLDVLKSAVDQVVLGVKECQQRFGIKELRKIVRNARRNSFQFETPCYIDLYSFCAELHKKLSMAEIRRGIEIEEVHTLNLLETETLFFEEHMLHGKVLDENDLQKQDLLSTSTASAVRSVIEPEEIKRLKNDLILVMSLIENVVVANAAGVGAQRAKGISIYFPQYGVDASYPKTEFAKDSLWLQFVQEML